MSIFRNITDPYNKIEAAFYERSIAPAVAELARELFHSEFKMHFEALRESDSILDVGCGGGTVLLSLCGLFHPSWSVFGIDSSAIQIKRALQVIQQTGCSKSVILQEASAMAIPFPDSHFDMVMSIASLKHWPDRKAGLRECLRVLKPGGTCLIVDVNGSATLDETKNFVMRWSAPRLFKRFLARFFFNRIVSQAMPIEMAKIVIEGLRFSESNFISLAGLPAFAFYGKKLN